MNKKTFSLVCFTLIYMSSTINGDDQIDQPSINTDKPTVTDQPASPNNQIEQVSISTDKPTVTDQPVSTDNPPAVNTDVPIVTDQPANPINQIEQPSVNTDKPTVTDQPVSTDNPPVPIVSDQPASPNNQIEQPAVSTDEPTVTDQPVTSDDQIVIDESPEIAWQRRTSAEIRAAAFFPMGHKFREIYGDVGLSLQAEVARRFKNHRHLGVWGNLEWIFMDGKPRGSCGRSSVDIFNLSFGLKGVGHFFDDILFVYGGIGPDVGFICLENKQRCCSDCHAKIRHRSRVALGGIVKTGAEVNFANRFYMSFFADYLYLPVHFGHTLDVGGFKVGGGLGIRF